MKLIYNSILLLLLVVVGCDKKSIHNQVKTEKKTNLNSENLLGQDLNKNGVRDDVDEFIQGSDQSENIKNALTQMATARFKGLIEHRSKNKSLINSHEWDRSLNCLSTYFEGDQGWYKMQSILKKQKALILNSKERIRANIIYNNQLSGTSGHPDFFRVESKIKTRIKACDKISQL